MEQITHKGRIVAIDPDITTIEIIAESACASCHAKGLCSLGEEKVKQIQVRTSAWTPRQVGDEVEVVLKKSMGYKAVFIAYGLPLVVLFVALMLLGALGVGELWAGLGALGAVAVCYFVLFLFRNKISKDYSFFLFLPTR